MEVFLALLPSFLLCFLYAEVKASTCTPLLRNFHAFYMISVLLWKLPPSILICPERTHIHLPRISSIVTTLIKPFWKHAMLGIHSFHILFPIVFPQKKQLAPHLQGVHEHERTTPTQKDVFECHLCCSIYLHYYWGIVFCCVVNGPRVYSFIIHGRLHYFSLTAITNSTAMSLHIYAFVWTHTFTFLR